MTWFTTVLEDPPFCGIHDLNPREGIAGLLSRLGQDLGVPLGPVMHYKFFKLTPPLSLDPNEDAATCPTDISPFWSAVCGRRVQQLGTTKLLIKFFPQHDDQGGCAHIFVARGESPTNLLPQYGSQQVYLESRSRDILHS